jgi:hypothetical protein
LRRLSTNRQEPDGFIAIALGTAAGFAVGLLGGVVLGEWLGAVHPERVRRLLRRGPTPVPADTERMEQAVRHALRTMPATRRLDLSARALDGGVVELTGRAPDERSRRAAGEAAAAVAGADAIVNRILVEGRDLPPGMPA